MATLFLMIGLPGAGKTTRARELSARHGALRLTPDEWMIPLFGEPEAGGKRDLVEGLLIGVALDALRLGTSAVLDFGFWAADERSALRWLAARAGADCRLEYVAVDTGTQLARIARRQAAVPHATYPMSAAEVAQWREQFQVPGETELTAPGAIPRPPAGWAGWAQWAEGPWPSLPAGSAPAKPAG
ncbi:MAG TPA: ATP-binding protein [Trebonia sp.]